MQLLGGTTSTTATCTSLLSSKVIGSGMIAMMGSKSFISPLARGATRLLSSQAVMRLLASPCTDLEQTLLEQSTTIEPSQLDNLMIPSPTDPEPATFPYSVAFTVLAAIVVAISYADRANLSTAIIPMARQFAWESSFSGFVLSAFWAGYALTQVLGGRLADRFGGEKLLVLSLFLWSISTGLTPIAAKVGNIPLLMDRVLLGAGEGMALPAIHSMVQKYVPKEKRSTSAAVVTSACYLGSLLSNLVSPLLIQNYGWQSCFVLFATIPPLIWTPLWFLFMKMSKAKSVPMIVSTTTSADAVNSSTIQEKTSVQELLRQPSVWAIIIAQYGQSWGMIGLLSWLPTYFNQRFNIPVADLGTFTVLPYLMQMILSVSAGSLADNFIAKGKRTIVVRNILQSIGMIAPALCLMACSLIPTITSTQALLLITIGSALSALTTGAVSANHFDLSPKNAGTIFGLGNTASCIGGLIAVPVSGYIFDTTKSWTMVFLLFSLHYVAGLGFWLKFASDQPLKIESNAPFTKID